MTTQELSLESILFRIARTADWRRSLAARYPDDHRNERAAEALVKLARSDRHVVSIGTWTALLPHLDTPALRNAVSEAGRDVEFRCHPADINDFLKIVIEKLAVPTRH